MFCLEGLVAVSECVARFSPDPLRAAGASVAGGCVPGAVAALAVDVVVLAVKDGVVVQLLLAGLALGALVVVALASGGHLLRLKYSSATAVTRKQKCALALW